MQENGLDEFNYYYFFFARVALDCYDVPRVALEAGSFKSEHSITRASQAPTETTSVMGHYTC